MQDLESQKFDYSLIDNELANYLKEKENAIKTIVSENATKIGEQLYLSQQKMANFNNDGLFGRWIDKMGFSRSNAYNYINRYTAVQNLDSESEIEMFESLPKSLTYDISKPSAPKEKDDLNARY